MAALQCDLCGGRLIGRPGGIFECDSCGMQYDTAWAKAKIQEIKGTVTVEGTVQVAGTVKVEGGVSAESLLKRGQLALEDKDWSGARGYFEKVLDIDPECTEGYFGLAMCASWVNTLDSLVNRGAWGDKDYIKGKRFAPAALLSQVEQLEQAYTQRKREEEEKDRIAREKREEEERIARDEKKQQLKHIRDRFRKASALTAAGSCHTVALIADGGVRAVGKNYQGQCKINDWRDLVQVSAGGGHTIGLKADGTVVATKYTGDIYCGACDVSGWRDIVAVCAGGAHTVGLKSDGTVTATGKNDDGRCNVSGWRNVVQIGAGLFHTVGLKSDGSVVAVGDNNHGQCDVSGWQDIVAVSAAEAHTVGLKSDGTVVAVGYNGDGRCDVCGWSDIVQVSAGSYITVGLKADGTVVTTGRILVSDWQDIVTVSAGQWHVVGLKADGTMVAAGDNRFGQSGVNGWRLFRDLDTLEQEREEARTAARIARERQEAGLCQHCGGQLKGLFGKKCASCGKPKDY